MIMSATKKINKAHPDYADYVSKCKKIAEAYFALQDAEEAKYPNWRGLDHPASGVCRKLSKEMNAKLLQLRQEYRHLFSVE